MAYAALNKSGCEVRKGNVKIRLDFFLDPTDPRYDERYLYLIDTTSSQYKAGYTGDIKIIPESELEAYMELGAILLSRGDGFCSIVEDGAAFDAWYESLPHIWVNTPFHSHFAYFGSDVTQDNIKAEMEFHLPNFYKVFQERWDEVNGGMRHGWATEKRIKPTDYSKTESAAEYDIRVAECQPTVDALTEFSFKPEAKEGQEFLATEIDIGSAATDRDFRWIVNTIIDIDNAANDTGTIDYFEVWAETTMDGTNKVGTFYGSDSTYTNRDGESIGTVTAGAKRTFSGLTIDATSGDFAGIYFSAGYIERDATGGVGIEYLAGDQFGTGQQDYILVPDDAISLYGTGETIGGVDYPISTSSALSLASSLSRAFASDRGTSSNLSLAVSASRIFGRIRTTSSDLSVTANISKAIAFVRATSSDLSLTATIAKSWARTIATSANLSLAVAVDRVVAWARATSSNLTLAASVSRVADYARASSSNLSLTTTVAKIRGWTVATSTNLSLTATVSRAVAWARTTSSSLSLTVQSRKVLDLQIAVGSDDGDTNWHNHFYCVFDATTAIYFGTFSEGYAMVCFLRWPNIPIPQAATITEAHISFHGTGSSSTGTACNADIDGDDEDNCATYSNCADLWARPRTDALVVWNAVQTWPSSDWYDGPDIASVIQEIINRGSWLSGNAIGVFIDGHRSDIGAQRYFFVQESLTHDLGAKLHIEWIPPAGISRIHGRIRTTVSNLSLAASVSRTIAYARATASNLSLASAVNRTVAFTRATTSKLSLLTRVVLEGIGYFITTTCGLSLATTISRSVGRIRTISARLSLTTIITAIAWYCKPSRIPIAAMALKRVAISRLPFCRREEK